MTCLHIFWCVFLQLLLLATGMSITKQPSYLVIAPHTLRPNHKFQVAVSLFRQEFDDFTVKASIRNGWQVVADGEVSLPKPATKFINLQTPVLMSEGDYTLHLTGYTSRKAEQFVFRNTTKLQYRNKQVSLFIVLSKPFYKQGQTVNFRIVPVTRTLMPVTTAMDVRLKNAQGYVIKEWLNQHTNAGGILHMKYQLNKRDPGDGYWTIEVNCFNQIYNKTFRVEQRFGLASIVNVSMPSVMFSDSLVLSGTAAATVYGTFKPIFGNATVTLEIMGNETVKLEQVQPEMVYEHLTFNFTRADMEKAAGGLEALIGKTLKVSVSFLEQQAFFFPAKGFQYAIFLRNTVALHYLGGNKQVFKPKKRFNIQVAASCLDSSPLPLTENDTEIYLNVIQSRSDGSNNSTIIYRKVDIDLESGVAEYNFIPDWWTSTIHVQAWHRRSRVKISLTATKYNSNTRSYIHIKSANSRAARIGNYMSYDITTNTFIETVHYMVVTAGGHIEIYNEMVMYTRSKKLSLAVTRNMIPSSTLIVYFISNAGEIITDSLDFYVDVTSSSSQPMAIYSNKGKDLSQNSVEIIAGADPLSYAAFSAMEYQLYKLGYRNDLTWAQVTDELFTYHIDTAQANYYHWLDNGNMGTKSFYSNGPIKSYHTNGTFLAAGLRVFTDATVFSDFTEFYRACDLFCLLTDSNCTQVDRQEKPRDIILNDDPLWRTDFIRFFRWQSDFMFDSHFVKSNGRLDQTYSLPALPPTSWVVNGFAMNRQTGLNLVKKPIIVSGERYLLLVTSSQAKVALTEQAVIMVNIYSNWREELDVLVSIPKSTAYAFINIDQGDSFSTYLSSNEHQILVPVGSGEKRMLNVPIKPLRSGSVSIPVSISSAIGSQSKIVKFNVVMDGLPDHFMTSYQVDLRIANAERLPDLFIPIKETITDPETRITNYVGGSPSTTIYISGDIVGTGFHYGSKFSLSSEAILGLPSYSGSSSLFNLAINFYSLDILRTLSTVNQNNIDNVLNTMDIALQELYSYVNFDGSLREFRDLKTPSTWLTAHVLETLSDIHWKSKDLENDFQIPRDSLVKMAEWLSQQQDQWGRFAESGFEHLRRFRSTKHILISEDKWINSNFALTSLCVEALSNYVALVFGSSMTVQRAIEKGRMYLEHHLELIEDPFELSITTHTLVQLESPLKTRAMEKLKEISREVPGMLYWSNSNIPEIPKETGLDTNLKLLTKPWINNTAYTVSATSYALLSYIKAGSKESTTNKIQLFLQQQRDVPGGMSGCLDTLLSVRALQMLTLRDQDRSSYKMMLTIKSDKDENWVKYIHLNRDNWFTVQAIQAPSHWGSIQIYAEGHGVALVQMFTTVNYENVENFPRPAPGANDFEFNVDISTSKFNHSLVTYKFCPRWTGPGERSGAVMLRYSIPHGYISGNTGLSKMVKSVISSNSSTIRQGRFTGQAVTIWYEYLDRTWDNCLTRSAARIFPVANLSYYNYALIQELHEPSRFKFMPIQRVEFNRLTVCLVCGSYQCPFCPNYGSSAILSPSLTVLTLSTLLVLLYNSTLLTTIYC